MEMPHTRSVTDRMKIAGWLGRTACACGRIAGAIEAGQNASGQFDGRDLAGLSEEFPPAQSEQSGIFAIEAATSWPDPLVDDILVEAIAIGAKAKAWPASPMLKAASRINARMAFVPFLIGLELTPVLAVFKEEPFPHRGNDLVSYSSVAQLQRLAGLFLHQRSDD